MYNTFVTNTHAQVRQASRFEYRVSNILPTFDITPAQSKGLYLHRQLTGNGSNLFEIIRLDTGLQVQWQGSIALSENALLVGHRSVNHSLFILFRNPLKKDFELYQVNQETGNFFYIKIKSYIHFSPTEFQATTQSILIGGYFNQVPLVLFFDLNTGNSKILPGLFNEKGELDQIKTYPDGSFQILISAKNLMKKTTIWIKSYTDTGNLINNIALDPGEKNNLLFARSGTALNGMQIIAGIYGKKNSTFSRGIFTATIDPNGIQQIKYHNFGDLNNFFNYLTARKETRIKKKIERRKIKGKKLRFNYRFLVHEVIEYQDQYLMLGEAFYPTYKSISQWQTRFWTPYYSPTPVYGNQVFDGYQYTHAAILCFNKNGDLLWDNSFEINDIKTWTLEQFVRAEIQEDRVILFYLFDNTIRTKIIKDNLVIEGQTIDPLQSRFTNDIAEDNTLNPNRLNYWYDRYFYAYGIQRIKNETKEGISTYRRVFFVNKIFYD